MIIRRSDIRFYSWLQYLSTRQCRSTSK